MRGIRVGDFSYCKEPLELGQLAGNRFQLLMRNCTGSNDGSSGAAVPQEQLEEQV